MHSNRRTFLKTTAAGVASITAATGAMAAPSEAQAGPGRERAPSRCRAT